MAKGGEIYLLDMGEPVRIRDLACTMIRLAGLTVRDETNPDGDIAIAEVGLRPGEKLYEELLISAQAVATDHPRIMMADEDKMAWNELERVLVVLRRNLEAGDAARVKALLQQVVRGYREASASVDAANRDSAAAHEAAA